MPRISQRIKFKNSHGQTLSGILEVPEQPPIAHAIFSHCFTCTKDLKAIVRISRRLAERGISVLRFDFTGLGDSEGDFSQTTFLNNIEDIRAAAAYLEEHHQGPQILIGHSLGGAGMIAVADQIPSARCVINIASPAHTQHLANYLVQQNPEIESLGVGDVVIGGRTHTIRRPMIEVLRNWNHPERIAALQLPLLILFSPMDETLSFDHGLEMFRQAGSAVSFVTLDGADHLLVNQPADIPFVSDLIATWATRYLKTGTGPVFNR